MCSLLPEYKVCWPESFPLWLQAQQVLRATRAGCLAEEQRTGLASGMKRCSWQLAVMIAY